MPDKWQDISVRLDARLAEGRSAEFGESRHAPLCRV
jgi:hypothetical protein